MINRTVLTGRLTRDPELRTTGNGISVTQFVLAVDRPHYKGKESGADFISCVAWRKTAELISTYFHRGSLVGIDGRVQTRSYDDKAGNRVYVTEIVVENVTFLESKKDANSNTGNAGNNGTAKNDPFEGNSGPVDITEDDLPF